MLCEGSYKTEKNVERHLPVTILFDPGELSFPFVSKHPFLTLDNCRCYFIFELRILEDQCPPPPE